MPSKAMQGAVNNAMSGEGFFDSWLKGTWDEAKYNQYLVMSVFPLTKPFMEYSVGKVKNKMYMDRYGYGYNDIVQPWNMPGTSDMQSGIHGGLNFVSSNVGKLYNVGSGRFGRRYYTRYYRR